MFKSFFQKSLLILFFIGLFLFGNSQQTAHTFIQETNYLLALPEGYDKDTTRKWPLVIFLHGSGESGTDISKVKVHGPPKLVEQGKKFPFILVSPQAPPMVGWVADDLFALINQVKKEQRVDPDRVYLTGLSMGGFGTWRLAAAHPEMFAAIAPICGGGDSSAAFRLRNIPIWCFHGAKDDVVPPSNSENMVKATRAYSPEVRYTLYPDANHNSWDVTYNNDSLYTWLLSKKRFAYKEVPISSSILKQYEGNYASITDTVKIIIENNSLVAVVHNTEKIPMKAASDELFFVESNVPVDLRFKKSNGKVESFTVMEEKLRIYRRLK